MCCNVSGLSYTAILDLPRDWNGLFGSTLEFGYHIIFCLNTYPSGISFMYAIPKVELMLNMPKNWEGVMHIKNIPSFATLWIFLYVYRMYHADLLLSMTSPRRVDCAPPKFALSPAGNSCAHPPLLHFPGSLYSAAMIASRGSQPDTWWPSAIGR